LFVGPPDRRIISVKLRTLPLHAFTGDRGFESISLQRRVQCEPGFLIRANILFLDSPQINARSAGHLRCCFSQDGDLVKRQFFS
jgi:hypothetical protein